MATFRVKKGCGYTPPPDSGQEGRHFKPGDRFDGASVPPDTLAHWLEHDAVAEEPAPPVQAAAPATAPVAPEAFDRNPHTPPGAVNR